MYKRCRHGNNWGPSLSKVSISFLFDWHERFILKAKSLPFNRKFQFIVSLSKWRPQSLLKERPCCQLNSYLPTQIEDSEVKYSSSKIHVIAVFAFWILPTPPSHVWTLLDATSNSNFGTLFAVPPPPNFPLGHRAKGKSGAGTVGSQYPLILVKRGRGSGALWSFSLCLLQVSLTPIVTWKLNGTTVGAQRCPSLLLFQYMGVVVAGGQR